MKYQLIVPPIVVQELVGFICGGVKQVGKTTWRVEVYKNECLPRVFRNDVRVPDGTKLPAVVYKLGGAVLSVAISAMPVEV